MHCISISEEEECISDPEEDPFGDPVYQVTSLHPMTWLHKRPIKRPRLDKIRKWAFYQKHFDKNRWDPTKKSWIRFRQRFGVAPTVITALRKKLPDLSPCWTSGDVLLMMLLKLKGQRLIDLSFVFGGGDSTISGALKRGFKAINTLDYVFTKAFPSEAQIKIMIEKLRARGLPNPEAVFVGDCGAR